MNNNTPPDWEEQYPNTAALLKKWGTEAPAKSTSLLKAAPAVVTPAEPKQPPPGYEAGVRTREMLALGDTRLLQLTALPPVQFSVGFGEGLWNFAKSVPALAKMAGQGLWLGVSDPVLAAKALGGLASEAYDHLRNIDVTTLPMSARPLVTGAVKAFEDNPSRASGRLVSEALLLVAPGKMMGAAKSMMKALPTIGRTGAAVGKSVV